MRFTSLRARLLLPSGVLLVLVVGGTMAWVSYQAGELVNERVTADLRRAAQLIRTTQAERYASLRITAELLAAFPDLNALAQTDAATIRDFLLDYQRRTQRADILILLSPQGSVLARTDAVSAPPLNDVEQLWIAPTLAGRPPDVLLETERATYLATAAAGEAAGTVFAFLIVGSQIDDTLAQRLRDTTGEEVAILGGSSVLGSTLQASSLPWGSTRDWMNQSGGSDTRPLEVTIGGERFLARAADTADDRRALFVGLQSLDQAIAPYRRIQMGLLVVGVLGVAVGIIASALLARQVTLPVARLVEGTRQVSAGNFEYTLDTSSIDELGELASSFNDMTRGLRERADMQKFVSHSTVEMIRAGHPGRTSAGERHTMTVLFSDIRGFTAFSETRPPERVVQMLNECLGIQAERVLKFGGDIDKFIGDAIVALFHGEDMALQAIRCAVDIQRATREHVIEQVPMAVGIGIATGEVVLGRIGGADRFDYTAVGLHVNVAARLSSMAAPHEILLSESTWLPVKDLVAAERLDEVPVRGLTHPVVVYRMIVGESTS